MVSEILFLEFHKYILCASLVYNAISFGVCNAQLRIVLHIHCCIVLKARVAYILSFDALARR